MFSKRPIRVKLLVGLGLLVVMVAILASSGLYSTYAYRNLVKSLSWRVSELPLAAEVSSHVNKLRILLSELRGLRAGPVRDARDDLMPLRVRLVREQFRGELAEVGEAAAEYRKQVEQTMRADFGMADNQPERDAVRKIEVALQRIHEIDSDRNWIFSDERVGRMDGRVGPAARAGGGIVQPVARQAERVRRGGARAVSHLAGGPVDHQRDGGGAVRAVRAAVLSLDFPAAANPDLGVARGGRRKLRLSHPHGHPRRNRRAGRGDERHDPAIPGHPRRPGPPGAGAHQAGGAERAIGQRGFPGGRRGPRDQQPAGLDRHVRRVAGRARPRAAGRGGRRRGVAGGAARGHRPLPADDPERSLPLQGDHRTSSWISRGWDRPSGKRPSWASWCRA